MATYRVTDPATGRTLRLTGDSPPTEQELEQIFSSVGSSGPSTVSKLQSFQPVPQAVQDLAEQVNIPSRMGRAAGVAIGKTSEATGISPMNAIGVSPVTLDQLPSIVNAASQPGQTIKRIGNAALRGAQAFRPGYKPIPDEAAYATTGEGFGNAAAMAGMGAMTAPLALLPRTIADTAIATGMTAIPQAQKGAVKVLPSDIGLPDSVVGNALVPVASGAAQGAAPALKAIAKGAGKQLESASGSVPGSLEAAYKDPSLIFSKGTEAAKPLYEAAKAEMTKGASLFEGMWKPEDIVESAQKYLAQGGTLEPAEALTARKAVDSLLKTRRYVKDSLMELRGTFDEMAKASKNIASADPAYVRGLQASSLRNLLPQNKYGGASAFKMGIAPALSGLGGYVGGPSGATAGAALAAGVLSPIAQGVAATGAGMASRALAPIVQNPLAINIASTLRRKKG